MKEIFKQFKYRKMVLAAADAFIISIAALITNHLLSLLDSEISAKALTVSITVSIISCFAALLGFGAYTKLWRYFHKKDYLSCVYGITVGIVISCILLYEFYNKLFLGYSVIHLIISVIGICLFRLIFKCTFIDLVDVGSRDAIYKKTMIIGGGQACRMLLKEISSAQGSVHAEERSTAMYRPVCIIDDDRSKIGTEIEGVTVVGILLRYRNLLMKRKLSRLFLLFHRVLKRKDSEYLISALRQSFLLKLFLLSAV